jgi:hypothetical protein
MKDIPAFPHGNPTHGGDLGMTLRDYFAARGMETLMTNVASELTSKHYSVENAQRIKDLYASMCYAMADAMLKAREA